MESNTPPSSLAFIRILGQLSPELKLIIFKCVLGKCYSSDLIQLLKDDELNYVLRSIISQLLQNIRISSNLNKIYLTSLVSDDNEDTMSITSNTFKAYMKLVDKGSIKLSSVDLTGCDFNQQLSQFQPLFKRALFLDFSWDKLSSSDHPFSHAFYKANMRKFRSLEIKSGIASCSSLHKLMVLNTLTSLTCIIKNQFNLNDFPIINKLLQINNIKKMTLVCYDINALFTLNEKVLTSHPHVEYVIKHQDLNFSNLLVKSRSKFQLVDKLNIQDLALNCNMVVEDINDLGFLAYFKTLKKLSIRMKAKNSYVKLITTGSNNVSLEEMHLRHFDSNRFDLDFTGFKALKYVSFIDCYLNSDILRLGQYLEELEIVNCKVNWSMKVKLPKYLSRLSISNSKFTVMSIDLHLNTDLTFLSLHNLELSLLFMNNLPNLITELQLEKVDIRYPKIPTNLISLRLDNATGLKDPTFLKKLKILKTLELFANGDIDVDSILKNSLLPDSLENLYFWIYKQDSIVINNLPKNLKTIEITIKKLKPKDPNVENKSKDVILFLGCDALEDFQRENTVYLYFDDLPSRVETFYVDTDGIVKMVVPKIFPGIEAKYGNILRCLKNNTEFEGIMELEDYLVYERNLSFGLISSSGAPIPKKKGSSGSEKHLLEISGGSTLSVHSNGSGSLLSSSSGNGNGRKKGFRQKFSNLFL